MGERCPLRAARAGPAAAAGACSADGSCGSACDLPAPVVEAVLGLGTCERAKDGSDHRLGLGTLSTRFRALGL